MEKPSAGAALVRRIGVQRWTEPGDTLSAMAVFETIPRDISVLAGQTLFAEWDCFSNDALTVPFDLTGYTLEAVLMLPGFDQAETPVTLTSGAGLTINAAGGIVQIEQPTAGWQVGRGRWYLQSTDPSGLVSYPLRGVLYVGTP
jgi:hypothetical protein